MASSSVGADPGGTESPVGKAVGRCFTSSTIMKDLYHAGNQGAVSKANYGETGRGQVRHMKKHSNTWIELDYFLCVPRYSYVGTCIACCSNGRNLDLMRPMLLLSTPLLRTLLFLLLSMLEGFWNGFLSG